MSLQTRLQDFITALGADIKDLKTRMSAVELLSNPLRPYPIGSIYTSVVSTNPESLFGGTWVAFGAGRMLIGINAAEDDIDTAEETGGSKWIDLDKLPLHTHSIGGSTGNNSADHTHGVSITSGGQSANHTHNMSSLMKTNNPAGSGASDNGGDSTVQGTTAGRFSAGQSGSTSGASVGHTHAVSGNTGGNSADHTHTLPAATGNQIGSFGQAYRPPYITVYMWKRTA
jgi:hypothetical protein